MSDDKLAERLAQAAADATGEPENCDTAVLQDRRNRWKEAYVINWDAVAAAARASIGDEIAAEAARPLWSDEKTDRLRKAHWYRSGMHLAEQIARGDTE